MQLSLFNLQPEWENITDEWLIDYMNRLYPDLKFIYVDDAYNKIRQSRYNKVDFSLKVGHDAPLDIWQNKTLVYLSIESRIGPYQGVGLACNNFDDLTEQLEKLYKTFKSYLNKTT